MSYDVSAVGILVKTNHVIIGRPYTLLIQSLHSSMLGMERIKHSAMEVGIFKKNMHGIMAVDALASLVVPSSTSFMITI